MRRTLTVSLALLGLAGSAVAGPAMDTDGDGMIDALDNCITVANAHPADCDVDQDGYGSGCDGDFDNGGTVNAGDFTNTFVPEFLAGVYTLTDMDCGGTTNSGDFTLQFVPQFLQGFPGPSGLSCAGTVPCP